VLILAAGVCTFDLLSGCTMSVKDLRVASVEVTDSDAWSLSGSENRRMLKVEVATNTDLEAFRRRSDALVHADTYFCASPRQFAVLGGTIFALHSGESLLPRPLNLPTINIEPSHLPADFTYAILVNASRRESRESVPPQIAFNLADLPQDICIQLAGSYLGFRMKSNIITIPSEAIRAAFDRRSQDSRAESPSNNRLERSRVAYSVR
jgi:hypothetical protein